MVNSIQIKQGVILLLSLFSIKRYAVGAKTIMLLTESFFNTDTVSFIDSYIVLNISYICVISLRFYMRSIIVSAKSVAV